MADGAPRAILAGFLVGYAFALLFTFVAAALLVRLRTRWRLLERAIAPVLSPLAVAVPLSLFTLFLWTAIGALAGVAYYGAEQGVAGGGLGSPNVVFTVAVAAFGSVLVAPWLRLLPEMRRELAILLLAYVALFGWALPHLAD